METLSVVITMTIRLQMRLVLLTTIDDNLIEAINSLSYIPHVPSKETFLQY